MPSYIIRENVSLKMIDNFCTDLHKLRLETLRVHESGKKGSFEKESEILNKYFDVLHEFIEYLDPVELNYEIH